MPSPGPHTVRMSDVMAGAVGLLESLETGLYLTDDTARIVWANSRAAELLRRPAADFQGHDAHDLLHRMPDGSCAPRSTCRLLQAALGRHPAINDEAWFARGDGTVLPVSWVTVPCMTGEQQLGGSVLFFERTPGVPLESPDWAAERLALVAETTMVLTSTLDAGKALRRLVRLVVPRLADWAVVDLRTDLAELRRVAVVHYIGGAYVNMEQFEGLMPPVSEDSMMPLSRVLRGGPPILVSPKDYQVPPDTSIAVIQRDLFVATGMSSAIIAPLRGPRGVLGALTVARSGCRPPFGPDDLALVDDIARRAGLAVDNAQLFERQRRVSETMQRHLLPALPVVAGMQAAVRYLPAPYASQVGGDWYDAFAIPDGSTMVAIGDVIGHDLQAAARMSQARNMLRAFAWALQDPPSLIVDRLEEALPHLSDDFLATLVLAKVSGRPGGPWRLKWTNAGHPPPLLVDAEGRADFLEAGSGLLVGSGVRRARADAGIELHPGSTLLLYTDGLVESAGEALTVGFARLARHAAALAQAPLGEFCDTLLEKVRPAEGEDDTALLALRVPSAAAGP
ncbi:SpoIIE family protein phosphatase [Peterkaempfera sp. SMS 1(5)a]|uniref:SpoIIE family protein phosphatase n=1 Tax=Peterkaempfera podocarpi TaxID=3232308 RepID=UPI00366D337E